MKYFKLLLIPSLLFFNEICYSQVKVEWEKKYGKKNYEYNTSTIAQTRDNGYILACKRYESLFSEESLQIIKINPEGDLVWEKTLGNFAFINVNSITQLQDGGYAITGLKRVKKVGDFLWLFKIDSLGNMIWEQAFTNTPVWNEGMVVKTDQSDNIIIGGVVSTNINNAFIAKVNSTGQLIWKNIYEKDESEIIKDICFDNKGFIYVAGIKFNIPNSKVFLRKINKDGRFIKDITLNDFSERYHIVNELMTSDSSLLVLGNTDNQKKDFLLLKVSLNYDIIWNKTIGTANDDYPCGIVELSPEKYLLSGWTNTKKNGGSDGWIVIVDKLGNRLWDSHLGGNKNDLFLSSIKTNDNGVIICGFTESGTIGKRDLWIIKLKQER